MDRIRILNGNALKIIAAISMTIDHAGLMFFPHALWMRAVGRIAFPIFAFMIAEGARYTRSRLRYFLSVFLLGAGCQTVYYLFSGDTYMNILLTFSLSILLIYELQELKRAFFDENAPKYKAPVWGAVFLLSVLGVYLLMKRIDFDYGSIGCMIPVAASLPDLRRTAAPRCVCKYDTTLTRIACLTLAVAFHATVYAVNNHSGLQFFALISPTLLLLYSGERGSPRLKYFFYVFYPVHLVILEGIYLLVYTVL